MYLAVDFDIVQPVVKSKGCICSCLGLETSNILELLDEVEWEVHRQSGHGYLSGIT